ncbi:Uncharacterised protein [Mycobacteroides abscessus]|nr:Uncharacterised protein [Mycobacteroides abscessus]SHT44221.1 Uncharacterised protein [Mycobacteroides abscessus subsp. abscessus]SHT75809.1 Uncharacterised protein [Mycobacteroides abscessus subsp. abscessus]SHV86159.1 Uncharacterised protein [Mycobacteroides abscessus subsp. abscessus]SKT82242.1 Uncharacterised protein [Mycobacteroides abscessus subsp. abscessus]
MDLVRPATRAVSTRPSGVSSFLSELITEFSRFDTAPRLDTESRRRSSWLYWSSSTPSHTQVPSVTTSTITPSAAMATRVRSEKIRMGFSNNR